MKKWIAAVCIGLTAAVVLQFSTGFAAECAQIRENVLRLHILANSDSEEDQTLKLKVRDRVLEETEELFYQADNLAAAKQSARQNLEEIRLAAEEEVERQGYDYPVKAEVVNMFFDTRVYEEFTLPAGHYDAVRITIGEAAGHNWWCMLYPSVCLPCATPRQELEENFTPEQADIVEKPQEYEIQFAVVELWEKLKSLWNGK